MEVGEKGAERGRFRPPIILFILPFFMVPALPLVDQNFDVTCYFVNVRHYRTGKFGSWDSNEARGSPSRGQLQCECVSQAGVSPSSPPHRCEPITQGAQPTHPAQDCSEPKDYIECVLCNACAAMSSALGVRQWYRGSTAASRPVVPCNGRHARDFGISFADDDSNGSKSLPPLPPLIPLVSNRRKRRLSSDKGQRGNDMSVLPSDSVNVNSDSQDNSKLLRLFGGGDSDSGVSVHSVEASDRVSCCKQPAASAVGGAVAAAAASRLTDVCSESVQGVGEGGGGPSRCTVLLDPIPSELLASLNCDGSISAEKASKTCQQTHEWEDSLPMISDNEVQGLLNGLVDDGAAEDDDVSAELARSQRQESLLQQPPPPPPLRDDVAPAPATVDADAAIDRDDVRDEESRDGTPPTATTPGRKLRHRKCEALPRRSTRARRERHSTSSVGEKRRKRSTSSSTTSSACSTTSHPHKHRHKHRHRHRSPAAPVTAGSEEVAPARPRVNPIFVWVKQEDTRIVEVLCEDYDKRNRIRLTKTPHGWRATPRTERLSSAPFFSAATTACSIEGGGGAEQENAHEDDDCEEEHDEEAALSMSESAHDHPDEAALKGLEDDNQIPPLNDNSDAVSLPTKADDLDEVVNEVPLDEEADEEDVEEEAVEDDEEEGSYNSVDKTLGMPLSPQTHVQSPPQVSSHRLNEHEDDSAPPTEQMEQDDSEDHEANTEDNEDVAEDSLIDTNLCISNSKVDADETKCEDDAEPLVETVLKSPAPESTECVAVAIDATVEREIKQVVQKDGIVLDEPMETEVSEPSKETVAEAEVAELLPTDLTVPKSADEPRPAPRVASVRSMASILRTPKVPMTMLASLHRASPRPGISPDLPEPAITPGVQPAHQAQPQPQHRSQFLESLLSTPKMCHQVSKPMIDSSAVPLDLGRSSGRSSTGAPPPQVTCSSDVIKSAVKRDAEEIPVKCKVEDITLKNLLTKRLEAKKVLKEENLEAQRKELEMRMAEESKKDRKSRLLELLTSSETINHKLASSDLDPLTQLKKILSDPEMAIPDPLLVPRDRLQDLVSCPAKEIPRLLTLRPELRLPEALAYPSLLQDPNLLVVSISYLQSLLRSPEKPSKDDSYSTLGAFLDWQRFQSQQQNDFLQAQMKQQSMRNGAREMDAATAQAFNQMMWLPYLNQLEASAMACGNNQEFLTMLNAVFPSGSYPSAYPPPSPFPPSMSMMPGFPAPADFKSQLEMQQTLAMWQEAMMQTAMPPPSSHSRNPLGVGGAREPPRRSPHSPKKRASSARTNPIGPKANAGSRAGSGGNHASMQLPSHLAAQGWQSHPYHSQLSHQQARSRPTSHPQQQQQQFSGPKQPKPEAPASMSIHPSPVDSTTRPTVKCKPLRNLLSSPRREDEDMKRMAAMSQSHSHLLSAFGKSTGEPPKVMDLAGARKASLEEKVAKLKVKQHLVDSALTPKLLKKEIKPEVAVGGDDKVSPTQLHPNLWHPLFGSQKASYNSPWQWTTVTVNGE